MRVPTLYALAAALSASASHAQPKYGTAEPPIGASDWTFSAGAAVASGPRYTGASKTRTMAIPTFDIRYRDWFFINLIRGVGAEVELLEGLKGSASVGASFDTRKAKDDARLNGLGDIGAAGAIRLGLDYQSGNAFVSSKLISRLGSSNGHGTLLEADAGYNVWASRAGVLALGLEVKAMDDTYARNFFGVSAQQSAASGLPLFNAKSGLASRGPFRASDRANVRPVDIFRSSRLRQAARRCCRQPDQRGSQPDLFAGNAGLHVLSAR